MLNLLNILIIRFDSIPRVIHIIIVLVSMKWIFIEIICIIYDIWLLRIISYTSRIFSCIKITFIFLIFLFKMLIIHNISARFLLIFLTNLFVNFDNILNIILFIHLTRFIINLLYLIIILFISFILIILWFIFRACFYWRSILIDSFGLKIC